MKKRNKIIILIIIGAILIFAVLRSVYYTYKKDKNYELNGWKSVTATCIKEEVVLKGKERVRYYEREYLYIVSGNEYILNTVEIDKKPYETIKYNPINPHEAETYEGINTETKVAFFISLIIIASPFILELINIKKTDKIKNRIKSNILRMSKRNIIKIITGCFWVYLGISLMVVLKDVFLLPNWSQVITQYSRLEIIIEVFIYIIGRCSFKKFTTYFNIFRI